MIGLLILIMYSLITAMKNNPEPIDIDNNLLLVDWSIGNAVLYVKGILVVKHRIRK
jgi:hypothetical protein